MAAPHRSRSRRMKSQIAEAQAVADAIGYSARTIVALRRKLFWGRLAIAVALPVAIVEAVALALLLSGTVTP
jgi:hypothetical protein